MVREGEGYIYSDRSKSRGETYERYSLYLPKGVATDSAFPFKVGERLKVRIEGDRLVVERIP
jgi:hypothetical protein